MEADSTPNAFNTPIPQFFGGEVVTSRYFHRKAVLSTLDQLGKTKTHTQGNLQKTRHTRPSSKKRFFLFFWFFFCVVCRTQPLGVLHDLLTPQAAQQQWHQQQQGGGGAVFSTSAIPWCLTVHFRNQPASLTNGWQNAGSAQEHFLTSLKVKTVDMQSSLYCWLLAM